MKISILAILMILMSFGVHAENSVEEFSFAPGLLTGETVKLPEIKLKQSKDVYGKGHHGWKNRGHGPNVPRIPKFPGMELTSSSSYPTTYTTDTTKSTTAMFLGQAKRELFIVINYEQLEEEMAKGEGERLNALSFLYGCPTSASKSFGSMTRKSYQKIFQNEDELTSRMFENRIKNELKGNKELANVCMLQ
ncbi:MAG: DUF3015 family protein [Leptospiraceae bacterium]|nr:DUF3015 family protein [Leptospiraceae bacterium]MCP5495856.1 DUF3015 family protein [Leptospiraceae bacterium]